MNAIINSKSVKSAAVSNEFGLENLEARQLMSAAHGHNPAVSNRQAHMAVVADKRAAKAAKAAKITVPPAPAPAPAPVSNAALGVSQVAFNGGLDLLINGTQGNDQITVTQNGTVFTIKNGTWSTTVTGSFKEVSVYSNGGNDSISLDASVTVNADLHGGAGNDTFTGGNGNDRIYGGTMSNVINGGAGDDILVTLNSTADSITGGLGNDSFWTDNNAAEKVLDLTAAESAAGNVHKVGSFLSVKTNTGTVAINKVIGSTSGVLTTLTEPMTTESDITYKSFAGQPLFSDAGPAADDVRQGYVGDCYFLSTLSSVAKTDANLIKQSVVDLGDGTYAVQFHQNGQSVFVRVDANLPTWSWGQLAYADKGAQGSIWTAVMEKAFTCFRNATQVAAYSNIDSGWMDEVYSDLGCNATDIWSATSGTQLLNVLGKALAEGKSATFAVNNAPAGSGLVSSHAYTVISVQNDAKGNPTLTLRNPWGVGADGTGNGYITVSATVAYQAFWAAMTATV